MAAALATGGVLLNVTGFDVALGGGQSADTLLLMRVFDLAIPLLCSGIAIWLIAGYPITEQKAHEVREQLERRRGAVN
jgi:GPH family glycoside/pentoside/hexuronide:cation symporter